MNTAALAAPAIVSTASVLSTKNAELAATQARLATLQKEVDTERNARFAQLHTEFGYESSEDFLAAYRGILKPAAKRRKARTAISDETKNAIIAELKAGKTNMEIATKHKVSAGTVQNIKKVAGLVQARAA